MSGEDGGEGGKETHFLLNCATPEGEEKEGQPLTYTPVVP